jgi:hypothetical protein
MDDATLESDVLIHSTSWTFLTADRLTHSSSHCLKASRPHLHPQRLDWYNRITDRPVNPFYLVNRIQMEKLVDWCDGIIDCLNPFYIMESFRIYDRILRTEAGHNRVLIHSTSWTAFRCAAASFYCTPATIA